MASAPQINLRDGSGTTQSIVLTTNQENLFLDGTVDTNTVDLQVSVNGAAFVSDPTLVQLSGQDFTVPNPASYPDGLELQLGENTILLRAIDMVGGISAVSSATITRVLKIEGEDTLIPTGVRVNRRRNTVDILAANPDSLTFAGGTRVGSVELEFRGYNFYASSSEGGTTGYYRINEKPVTTSTTVEEDDAEVATQRTEFQPSGDYVRIIVQTEDEFGQEDTLLLNTRVSVRGLGLTSAQSLRFSSSIEEFTRQEYIYFRHDRAGGTGQINTDLFVDVDSSDPLYYVVAGVYYDPTTSTEFETPYSQEILGAPLILDTTIRDLPGRTQLQVILDFVSAIQRVNSEISLIPGSTTRDVEIDPFSSEAERIWFLIDFVHRSQSFLTLLQIDDANGDGVSDPVVSSAYKQALRSALGLQTDSAVQQLIDAQFDKLAGNVNKPRLPGRPAVGQAVYYSATRPLHDVLVASGSIVSTNADASNSLPAVRYVVGGTFILPAADAEAYYNFDRRRYEIVADIVAETIGGNGNRPADAVKNVVTPVEGFSVTNLEAIVYGLDRESNADLAARCELGFVSVDTGTEGGYASTAASQVGIIKTKIVKSGDSLMMRDYDEVRAKHIGGKVDIWIQGLRERTVTKQFAFAFEEINDTRCQIIDLANLVFRVLDTRVTVSTPIIELLNNPSLGFGVRNGTTGLSYDLTGVVLLDYNTFQLDTGIAQPATNIDDIITADIRYRSVNRFVFDLQPVRRVVSVVGQASGALDNTLGYGLYKTDDPLLNGESTIAQDYLVINQVGGIPTGDTITVNDEQHIMIGFFEEPLTSIGVNPSTLRVFSADRSIEYDGPSSVDPDFEIVQGTATTPLKIVRTTGSAIVSGQTVSVDYEHDENFTVTFVVNDLLQQLQRTVDKRRHTTADVLIKQAVLNSINLETTAQLKAGATKDKTDPAIRSAVSLELNQRLIGQGVAQSDVVNAIDSTEGVDFQVLPFARMGYADGSRKLRESVPSTSQRLSSLDIGGTQVFILVNALQYPTTDGGGLVTEHKGVFQDDVAMTLSTSLNIVGQSANQAYIIGASGATISGFSDDATLIAAGFTTASAIETERLRRTSNHVVLSLSGAGSPTDVPGNHSYAVSYVVRSDRGPHDMTASQVEFLDLGDFTLTIRSAE